MTPLSLLSFALGGATWNAATPFGSATMNGVAATCLTLGWFAIRAKNPRLHKFLMVSAFAASTIFLVGYLAYHAVHGDIRSAATERQLWPLADRSVSSLADVQSLSPYTQGLMDLGAMVCTPRRPLCQQCPLAAECCALAIGRLAGCSTPSMRYLTTTASSCV